MHPAQYNLSSAAVARLFQFDRSATCGLPPTGHEPNCSLGSWKQLCSNHHHMHAPFWAPSNGSSNPPITNSSKTTCNLEPVCRRRCFCWSDRDKGNCDHWHWQHHFCKRLNMVRLSWSSVYGYRSSRYRFPEWNLIYATYDEASDTCVGMPSQVSVAICQRGNLQGIRPLKVPNRLLSPQGCSEEKPPTKRTRVKVPYSIYIYIYTKIQQNKYSNTSDTRVRNRSQTVHATS